jgi:beta-alanine--pyruvate transaminase
MPWHRSPPARTRNGRGAASPRAVGLTAGIDVASQPGSVGRRAYDAMVQVFNAEDVVIRITGETIALTPPLIVREREIEEIFGKVARGIRAVA